MPISVVPVPLTGVGVGEPEAKFKKSRFPKIGCPPRDAPPKLSAIKGILKSPPPTNSKLEASIFGNEAVWPLIKSALSEYPAVKEFPIETYFEKSAEPGV